VVHIARLPSKSPAEERLENASIAEKGESPAPDNSRPAGMRTGSSISLLVFEAPVKRRHRRPPARRDPAIRFRFDVLLTGEDRWTSNHLRFADEGTALARARGLQSRWIVIDKIRVVTEDAAREEPYVEGSAHPDGTRART
jgi:hypothetical protein